VGPPLAHAGGVVHATACLTHSHTVARIRAAHRAAQSCLRNGKYVFL